MDIWYELAIREMVDVEDPAAELRREAEELSDAPPSEDADEDEE